MNTVLLVSNRKPDEPGGRAEKFETRTRLLADQDWRVVLGVVNPTVISFLPGILRCLRLAIREDVDVINSVSNPPHLQVVGWVVSLLTGVPLLAEFRDPMVNHPDVSPGSVAYHLRAIIERLIVRRATMIVWDDGIQLPDEYFAKRYPSLPRERWFKLPPLGFERKRFEIAQAMDYEKFTITYAGSFYEGWIEPYIFIEGLGDYISDVDTDDLLVQFFGDWGDAYQEAVEQAGIDHLVRVHDFVPYDEVVPVLKGSDAVLYIGGDEPRNRLNIPSKIYDYIGAQTPIIAIVDPTFRVAHLIRTNDLGIVVSPDDPAGVADAIRRIRSNEFTYDPNPVVVEAFSREHKMEVFSDVLDAVAENQTFSPAHADSETHIPTGYFE